MRKTESYKVSSPAIEYNAIGDFFILIKTRLTLMVVFTSIIAYVLISGLQVTTISLTFLFLGGFLVAGASNALNQALEKDYDSLMERTALRPIAAGRMSISTGILIAGFMSLFGITILALFNPLTAFLGTLSFLTYSFVYTPLKRHSTVAVYIGAVTGALPVLIGCVAFEGYISKLALCLFCIQYLWQLPHFWAIAFLAFKDYRKAGFKFVPVKKGYIHPVVMLQSVIAGLILLPVSLLTSYWIGLSLIGTILICICALGFLAFAVFFYRNRTRSSALALMLSSLVYLPTVLSILLLDLI